MSTTRTIASSSSGSSIRGPAIRLRERPLDIVLIAVFSIFLLTSCTLDAMLALGVPLDGSSKGFVAKMISESYVAGTDPLLSENPPFVQVMAAVNAFVFGPFYGVVVYALWTARRWIRLPALIYAGTMTYNMVIIFGVHLIGPYQHEQPVKFIVLNLSYLVAPVVLGFRMRRSEPFAASRAAILSS